MNTKHTPGPWEACEVLNGLPHTEIREENFGTLKAQFFGEGHRKNAVLCAMAPELLAALESCADFLADPYPTYKRAERLLVSVRVAIAKAEEVK